MSSLKNKSINLLEDLGLEKWMKNIQVMGNEVILDIVSHSPTMHERKRLEQALKAAFADQLPEAKLNLNILVDVPEKEVPNQLKGKKFLELKISSQSHLEKVA